MLSPTQVIDADLSKYFDSIPHTKLMAVVAESIVDGGILHLINLWLKAPVIGEDTHFAFAPYALLLDVRIG